jgi:hypothetical protein
MCCVPQANLEAELNARKRNEVHVQAQLAQLHKMCAAIEAQLDERDVSIVALPLISPPLRSPLRALQRESAQAQAREQEQEQERARKRQQEQDEVAAWLSKIQIAPEDQE